MSRRPRDGRLGWLAAGIAMGLGLASMWPSEPAYAVATDRDSGFAMATCNAELLGTMEALFVVDFLTGQLKGAALNRQTGKFTSFYFRNLAADFNVDPKADPHYAIVTGLAQLNAQAGLVPAPAVIYVGDRNSGKIIAYSYVFKEGTRVPPFQLIPLDGFQFREPSE